MLGLENESDPRTAPAHTPKTVLRKPGAGDGPGVSGLVRSCPPLDRNSPYCNLLQCTDFADTCVLADHGGALIGWVSAYRMPKEPSALFIWQVAVHPAARGERLGCRMIVSLLQRRASAGIRWIKTTITPDNDASRALFQSLASSLRGSLDERPHFDRERHFLGRHADENLITIGPIATRD